MARLINLANEDVDTQYNLEGFNARDMSGDKMGDVGSVIADADSMQPRYLVVDSGGWFSSKKYVVPMGEVDHVDDGNKDVFFRSLTKDQLKSGTYPQYDDSWWNSNNSQAFGQHEQQLAGTYAGTPGGIVTNRNLGATPPATSGMPRDNQPDNQSIDYNSDMYRRPAQGAQRLQLLEEHLKANKERYQAGAVRLGKRIIERQETLNVPVTEERVVIERRPLSDTAADGAQIGKDQTIEVPVQGERVNVSKETMATEEVDVRKEAVQRTERVQGEVRKEELVVDDQGNLIENADGMNRPADREGRMPDPALRNRQPSEGAAGYRPDSPEPVDNAAATLPRSGVPDRSASAGSSARDAAQQGKSAIDSKRSDTPGLP